MIDSAGHGAAAAQPLPAVHRLGLPARRQLRYAGVDGAAAQHVGLRHWNQPLLPRYPAQPDEGAQGQSHQLRRQQWYGKTLKHSPVTFNQVAENYRKQALNFLTERDRRETDSQRLRSVHVSAGAR